MDEWLSKAALFELLAKSFLYTSEEVARALATGEYVQALTEIAALNGIDEEVAALASEHLEGYKNREPETVFHDLRKEYTRLFIGSRTPIVSPFASIWAEDNVASLLFVSKEAVAVEQFMRSCGSGRPAGTNEPLDHIGTELEFLEYLCLVKGGAVEAPQGVEIPEDAFERFHHKHFSGWTRKFAEQTMAQSREPFFTEAARMLLQVV